MESPNNDTIKTMHTAGSPKCHDTANSKSIAEIHSKFTPDRSKSPKVDVNYVHENEPVGGYTYLYLVRHDLQAIILISYPLGHHRSDSFTVHKWQSIQHRTHSP